MAPQPSVTILVIDDEASVVNGLVRILRRDGYTVETADNGAQALGRLSEHAYDLLLCDVRMPDLDGATFYGRLLLQQPALARRVIFLTGDTLNAESMAFLERSGQPWLSKPCTAADVRRVVAQLLRTLKATDSRARSRAQRDPLRRSVRQPRKLL
jgi:CheY-like chemotaxis protein